MYAYVVPAGIATITGIVLTFAVGICMRPVRKRYRIDLLPVHRILAGATLLAALLHVAFQHI